MHMIVIAWLFIAISMALTEPSFVAGLATFLFYGLAPLALFLATVGPFRSRVMSKHAHRRNRQDPEPDQ